MDRTFVVMKRTETLGWIVVSKDFIDKNDALTYVRYLRTKRPNHHFRLVEVIE